MSSPPANALVSTLMLTPTNTIVSNPALAPTPPATIPSSCSSTASSCSNTIESSDYKLLMQNDGNLVLYRKSDNKAMWASQTPNKGVGPYKLIMQPDANLVVYDSKNAPLWSTDTSNKGIGPYKLLVLNNGSFSVSDSKDVVLWASNTVAPAPTSDPVIATAPVITRVPSAPVINVVTNTSLEQYVKYEKMDHDGDDIECLNDTINVCSEKCIKDPLCKSINSWNNGAECCYKRTSFPLAEAQYVTTYVRKEADSCYSITNDDKCNNTIETANYKLTLQPDGNLVLYNKSNNGSVWNSGTYSKGIGPYRLVMQPDGNLVIYDSKNIPTWSSNTFGKGKGPYKLQVSNNGYITILDSTNKSIWSSVIADAESKTWNNCVSWSDTTPGWHNDWCVSDIGANWQHTGQVQDDCIWGQGKGVCTYIPPASGTNKVSKTWNNCVQWLDTTPETHNDWCASDIGPGFKHTGQTQADCIWSQGKGICTNY
ncbi:MAG: hypothetical protein ACRCZI_03960 [Cetobacterium sp.]